MEEQTNAVIDEEFGVDLSDILTEEPEEAGNQTGAEGQQEQQEQTTPEPQPNNNQPQEQTGKPEEATGNQTGAPDGVKIKFLGNEEVVPNEEVPRWVQMGKNAERVQRKNAQLEAQLQEQARWKAEQESNLGQLQALADAAFGGDIGKTLTAIRVNMKVNAGMSQETAAQAVRNEDLQRQIDARKAQDARDAAARDAQNRAMQRQQEDINNFVAKYPNVNPQEIPKSVWADVQNGTSLVNAYGHYVREAELNKQIEKLTADVAALKQNKVNEQRAVGSAGTSGGNAPQDDFLTGLNSAF